MLGKLVIGIAINSVSVISEAAHSGMDLVASVIAFFAVRESGKPPDSGHPFGHGKAEAVSGAFEGMLIFVAIVIILYESVRKLLLHSEVERVDWGLWVMGASVVVNVLVSWQLFRVARKTDSLALEADALHLSTDVFTSLGVFAGLLAIRLTGFHLLDPLIALAVAVVIGHAAYRIIRRSVRDLMDERLSEDDLGHIEEVLRSHYRQFIGFHDLRSRKTGSKREIDLHLLFCRHTHLEDAHAVTDHLEEELREKIPKAHVTIHMEPCEEDCDAAKGRCEIEEEKLEDHLRRDAKVRPAKPQSFE
jgi:cation diffusion facilitator family transporter